MSHATPKHADGCQYIRRWHCALDCHHDAVEEALDADRAHIADRLRRFEARDEAQATECDLSELAHKIERGES